MPTATRKATDKELLDTVQRQIGGEPEIRSRDINVGVHDSVVTLTGFVHTYPEKFAAERAAKSVFGVQGVANDIQVKPAQVRTDPEIARDVVNALNMNISVPDERVKTSVRDGIVTLEGTVDWNFQRESAEAAAHSIAGVRSINNHIKVKPKASTAEVKSKIEEALKRNAEVDARRITVTQQNGTIHLFGNVRSWAEKDQAQRAAWSAPGVSNVVCHLAVVP